MGDKLRAIRAFAERLTSVVYVRIVDKGPGLLWGFCKKFVWDALLEFMTAKGYVRDSCSVKEYTTKIREMVQSKQWSLNQNGEIALLYLLSEAKSLKKKQWLWCPIAAARRPFVCRKLIRTAS